MLTYDPNVGFLLNGQRANLHGSVGRNVLDASTAAPGALDQSAYDPRYYESYTDYDGDAGAVTRYRLKPDFANRLGGRTQLKSHSVGGYGEAIDPSQVEWDDEFGLLTSRTNIKDPETPRDRMIGNLAMAAFAAPIGYGIALDSGLLGAAGSVGGTDLGSYSAMTTGLDGVTGTLAGEAAGATGAMATIPENLLQNITVPPLDVTNPTLASLDGLTGAPWYQQLGQYAMNNPMTTARGLLGAANLINTLSGGRGGSGGGMSYDLKLPDGVQPLNPLGLLSGYTPRQIPLVPFMSQSSLLGGK